VLAVDVIGKLVKHATSMGILQPLHPRRHVPAISLYADDVVLFCHPSCADNAGVKGILQLSGSAFSLYVNYSKSTASLRHCDDQETTLVTQHLTCPIAELPITYLGIPLSTSRLTAAQQPMVDRVAASLPT
jgi:hypothetical protein